MKLKEGKKYNTENLHLLGWHTPEGYKDFAPGYLCWDHFEPDGECLGPDLEGVEPDFMVIK